MPKMQMPEAWWLKSLFNGGIVWMYLREEGGNDLAYLSSEEDHFYQLRREHVRKFDWVF